jgi:carbamoyltransferase
MMNIIGLSADHIRHDTSLALIQDGRVVFASPEERFSKLKHDPRAPILSLNYLLEKFDLTLDDIDAFAVGMPPFKLLKGIGSCGLPLLAASLYPLVKNHPGEFMRYFKERRADAQGKRFGFEWLESGKRHYISHYLAHGASAYRTSGFDEAISVNLDAAGADESGRPWSGAVFKCSRGNMRLVETIDRYSSAGCFYNSVTQAVGFHPVGEDWKLMGLAAFGDPKACYNDMAGLMPAFNGRRWEINRYSVEAKLIDRPRFLKNTRLWKILSSLVDQYGDHNVAAAAQRVLEDRMLDYFGYLIKRYGCTDFALAGGMFHNIKLCMRLAVRFPQIKLYVQPAAGDVGVSMGAALELHHRMTGSFKPRFMDCVALGAEYSEADIRAELIRYEQSITWKRSENLAGDAARLLAQKKVVGFYHGRAEWGPRALGQRSVLADASNTSMRDRINATLKDREWFMPFAPSIMEEDAERYLENYFYSPHMTHAFRVTEQGAKDLYSAVHLDGTVRPQIVRREILPHYHAIISEFKKLTGKGGVLNTSFKSPRPAHSQRPWRRHTAPDLGLRGCVGFAGLYRVQKGQAQTAQKTPQLAYRPDNRQVGAL